jgi:hypothetical protein
MEIPAELKSDLQRTLLGPLSLAVDLYGALIPGCVFTILICIKLHLTGAALSYPLLGYKTKIALLLFVSYIVGKISLSVIGLVQWLFELVPEMLKSEKPQQPKQENTNQLAFLISTLIKLVGDYPRVRTFFAGVIGGSILSNKFQVLDHYTANEAGAAFHLNTGLLLITCSLIPGDGRFRLIEIVAGLILLLYGVKARKEGGVIVSSSYGIALNNYLTSLTPEQLSSALKLGIQVVAKLAQTRLDGTPMNPGSAVAQDAPATPNPQTPTSTSSDSDNGSMAETGTNRS